MNFVVYILRTSKNTLYVGQTSDLKKRLEEHRAKSRNGAKYLRMFIDVRLVYTENFPTRSEALKREAEIKKWTKKKKESLIASCYKCGICCRLFFINIQEKEWESGEYETMVHTGESDESFATIESYGGNILRQQKDGSCIYLKDTLCTIHTRRPQVCQEFFCTSTDTKFDEMKKKIIEQRENDTM